MLHCVIESFIFWEKPIQAGTTILMLASIFNVLFYHDHFLLYETMTNQIKMNLFFENNYSSHQGSSISSHRI